MKSRIKELRKKRGLMQQRLASELGITQQMLSKYERDVTLIKVDVLKKIAKYFNVTTDYLLTDSIETSINNNSQCESNIELQELKSLVTEDEYQYAIDEAKKEKHFSYWVIVAVPFIMILAVLIYYYCFYR